MTSKVFQLYQKFHGRCTISFFLFSFKVFLLFAHKAQKQESAIKLLWVNITLSFYYSIILPLYVLLCLSVHVCLSLTVCLCLSPCLYVSLSFTLCLSVSLFCLSLSLTLSLCESFPVSVSQSLISVSFFLILFLNLPSFLLLSYFFRLFTILFL